MSKERPRMLLSSPKPKQKTSSQQTYNQQFPQPGEHYIQTQHLAQPQQQYTQQYTQQQFTQQFTQQQYAQQQYTQQQFTQQQYAQQHYTQQQQRYPSPQQQYIPQQYTPQYLQQQYLHPYVQNGQPQIRIYPSPSPGSGHRPNPSPQYLQQQQQQQQQQRKTEQNQNQIKLSQQRLSNLMVIHPRPSPGPTMTPTPTSTPTPITPEIPNLEIVPLKNERTKSIIEKLPHKNFMNRQQVERRIREFLHRRKLNVKVGEGLIEVLSSATYIRMKEYARSIGMGAECRTNPDQCEFEVNIDNNEKVSKIKSKLENEQSLRSLSNKDVVNKEQTREEAETEFVSKIMLPGRKKTQKTESTFMEKNMKKKYERYLDICKKKERNEALTKEERDFLKNNEKKCELYQQELNEKERERKRDLIKLTKADLMFAKNYIQHSAIDKAELSYWGSNN